MNEQDKTIQNSASENQTTEPKREWVKPKFEREDLKNALTSKYSSGKFDGRYDFS